MDKLIMPLLALAAFLFMRTKSNAAPANVAETPPVSGGGFVPGTDAQFQAALEIIAKKDGSPVVARLVEKIFRLETDNFKSGGYKATNAPGQKAFTLAFPWGWPARGTVPTDYSPPVRMVDTGEEEASDWVVYNRVAVAAGYLAQFLRDHNLQPGRWNSTDPARQAAYNAKLQNISTPLADAAWAKVKNG